MNGTRDLLPPEVYEDLIERFVPHWHACVAGPPQYGTVEPVKFEVNRIVRPSREEAEAAVWAHVENLCRLWRREFDTGDWRILHLTAVNCG